MGAVQTDQAGIGSAVNDATREVGGTLGVAVIGSVFASLYAPGPAADRSRARHRADDDGAGQRTFAADLP